MRISFLLAICISTMGCAAWGQSPSADSAAGIHDQSVSAESVGGQDYRQRYALANATQKLVDDHGNGYNALYGVRNFRSVLNGVYYRGGANNAYNTHGEKRGNSNPLPNGGLQDLCQEGFTQAVYLYPTNFGSAPKATRCRTFQGNDNVLNYAQVSILSYAKSDQLKVLTMIQDHVRNPRLGPIYIHCWNGWHASGYTAAITLRQFCGFSGDQAVAYWNVNTDGVNKGPSYDKVRAQIRAFQPFSGLDLSAEEKATLCPNPGSLAFVK